ncbi:MAG TPA: LUD domain-containing protein, partial [Acidimicrobiia bacterium]|nr:LUD domain-containing protein [Acidimicrobiia bacterium]
MTTYRDRARAGVVDPRIAALQRGTDRFRSHRAEAVAEFADMDEMRNRAQVIRHRVLSDLSGYVDQFSASVERVGGRVHRAADSEAARKIITDLVADRIGSPIIKSKSMATEEIGLNHHLEARGHEVVETDLGEFIIQLAAEPPVHIIAPALDRTRHEIGQLFADQLGVPFTSVP